MALVATNLGVQTAVVGTEHALAQQANNVGIYVLMVDTAAMGGGDQVVVKLKTKRAAEETVRVAYRYVYDGAQVDEPQKYSVPVPVDTEIVCTLTQTAGVSKTFPWKLYRM